MGSVALSEGIMLIASITVAAGISMVVLNQMGILQSSIVQSSSREKEVTLTKIKTLYVANTSSTTFNVWAKNVGSTDINSLDRIDLYFGKVGSARQIPHNGGSAPFWTLNDSSIKSWRMMDTLQINVTNDTPLETNTTYFVRIVTPNGISDDYVFSVS